METSKEKRVIKKILTEMSKEDLEKLFKLPGYFTFFISSCFTKDNLEFLENKGIVVKREEIDIDEIPPRKREKYGFVSEKLKEMESQNRKIDLEEMIKSSNDIEEKAILFELRVLAAVNEDIEKEFQDFNRF